MKRIFLLVILFAAALAGAWDPPSEKLRPETKVPALSKARWIWFRCVTIPEKSLAAFRRKLIVNEPVESAVVHAACDDNGRLFFNGERLRHDPVDPRNADRFVRTYRIPPKLWKKGCNVLAAEVFNDEGQGALIARGEVRLASGKVLRFVSDGDWRAMELPVDGDWQAPAFDDSRWGHAMELGGVLISPWRSVCRRLFEFMLDDGERAEYGKYIEEKAGNIDFLRDAPDVKGRIVWRNGRAGIELDGKVVPPMLYIAGGSPWDPHNADAIIKANAVGFKFIEIQNTASRFMIGPGVYDFSRLDEDMRRAAALAPDATFCLSLSFYFGYTNWHQTYPDALIGYATGPADGKGGQIGRFRSPSMADPLAYRELEACATQFMEYIKSRPWYKRVTMIRLCHGVTAEWHYYGMSRDMPDTSPAMTAAFRRYLRGKYASNRELQEAWKNPSVTLDTALVPGAGERFGRRRYLRDPASADRQVLDYYDCMQDVIADLLLHFTGCVKRADPRLIVGVYYGYLYHMAFPPEGQVIRFDKVLASPNVDFLSSPFNYDGASRHVGGDFQPRSVSDPFKCHGKLIMYEADTRTHIAGLKAPCSSMCHDAAESVAVLRGNIARAFLDGGGVQFLEFDARRDKQCWFNHPEIWRTFRQSLELWQKLWNASSPDPAAQVAVVISPEELVRHGYPTRDFQLQCIPNIIDNPTHALLRSGVTCDFMTLRGFLESPHEYRTVVLLNVFSPSPEERRQLMDKLRRKGVAAIWNYAPGLVTEHGYDDDAMSDLCGIALRSRREKLPMAATLSDGAKLNPIWNKKPWSESPRVCSVDPRAETLAVYGDGENAIALKRLDDGSTTVFCGMPGITAHFWRVLWKKLGVPTLSEPDSVVTAGNPRHLMVHTGKGGALRLHLPPDVRSAVEVYTRERFPVADGVLSLKSPTAATWFLELE